MSTLTEKRNLTEEIQTAFIERGFEHDSSRNQALELFLAKGFPGPKSEEYKFTPITRLLEKALDLNNVRATENIAAPVSLSIMNELKCNVVAFVNGQFSKDHSVLLDEEIRIQSGAADDAKNESDPFDLLNQAFTNEVIEISIGSKKSVRYPLAIIYYFDSPKFVFANPRWRCKVGSQSSLTVLEYVHGPASSPYFNNKQSSIEAGENSQIEYITIQNGPATGIEVNNTVVHLSASAQASCFTFTFDGQLIRNNLTLTIDGQGVDAHLYGLYLLSKNTLADNHTVVDHRKPNSFSNELYKGVMDGNSKGVFNGKIYVRPQAQKTNAFQSNRNILLGSTSTVNTKPQLEIWADDVKCSHGCTTGQLDEEALFYLRSRGISKEMARGMMLYAFAGETIVSLKNETIKSFMDGLISEKLHKNF